MKRFVGEIFTSVLYDMVLRIRLTSYSQIQMPTFSTDHGVMRKTMKIFLQSSIVQIDV